ncbi:MAG: transposase, partial [Bacteroidota bacterium]
IKAINEDGESRRESLLNKSSYAAKRIKRGVNYKVWQYGFHPIELSSNKMMDQQRDYIRNNPVVEEFVHQPEQWVDSSAGFYICEAESLVRLEVIQ